MSQWTVDTLKDYIQVQLDMQANAVRTALASAEKAVEKANIAADKRFEGVNEFRGQLTDQAATFLSRAEYQAKHDALVSKVDDAVARLDRSQGKSMGVSGTVAMTLTLIGLVVAVLAVVVTR